MSTTPAPPEPDAGWVGSLGYYHPVRRLPTGELGALATMLYTTAVVIMEPGCVPGQPTEMETYSERWCYKTRAEALLALTYWDGEEDPPGNWVVHKPSQRQGPGGGKT